MTLYEERKAMNTTPKDYDQVLAWLSTNYEEVQGEEFYRDIFPDNESSGDNYTDFSHPNAVYLYQGEDGKMHRRIMLKDTWANDYMQYVERNPMTLCSGLAFRGRSNKMTAAQRMYAMIFDLDKVGYNNIRTLFLRVNRPPEALLSMPQPTYIVASGSGLHVYYVFTEPVDLYPNIKTQAKALKYDLTYRLWDYKSTSQLEDVQYQGIAQGFRMVGSINSKYGTVVRAFRTGPKLPFEVLNSYAEEKNQVDLRKPFRPTQMSLKEAQHKYPEWYQKRIVEKQQPEHWHIKRDLYEWWKRQFPKVKGGHRYFFLMCLAIYASKCDVPKEDLQKDMEALFEPLSRIEHDGDPFSQRDVASAMEAYDKSYYCYTINDIEHLMAFHIDRNRRNGRPQKKHLIMARLIRDEVNGHKDTWRKGNGRKPKSMEVYEYREKHPEARKADCIRDTGLSKPTVYRWWNYDPVADLEKRDPALAALLKRYQKKVVTMLAPKEHSKIVYDGREEDGPGTYTPGNHQDSDKN